jgi:hypothetical protein
MQLYMKAVGASSMASTLDVTGAVKMVATLDVTAATNLKSTVLVGGTLAGAYTRSLFSST